MKCPLFCIGDKRVQLGEETEYGECLKEECAWWILQGKVCAITSLACDLQNIFPTLQLIQNKMLHEGQVRL